MTIRHAALIIASPLLAGCTFVGLGIGTTVPRYETVSPPYEQEGLGHGARVSIRNEADPIIGRFEGVRDKTLVVETSTRTREIAMRDIDRVELRRGSYWLAGLLIGLAVDVAVVAIVDSTDCCGFGFGIR